MTEITCVGIPTKTVLYSIARERGVFKCSGIGTPYNSQHALLPVKCNAIKHIPHHRSCSQNPATNNTDTMGFEFIHFLFTLASDDC